MQDPADAPPPIVLITAPVLLPRREVRGVAARGSVRRKLALSGSLPAFSSTTVKATAGRAEAFSSWSLTAEKE